MSVESGPSSSRLRTSVLGRGSERTSPEELGPVDVSAEKENAKLTESAREFPNASAQGSPNGSLREAWERLSLGITSYLNKFFLLTDLFPLNDARCC